MSVKRTGLFSRTSVECCCCKDAAGLLPVLGHSVSMVNQPVACFPRHCIFPVVYLGGLVLRRPFENFWIVQNW